MPSSFAPEYVCHVLAAVAVEQFLTFWAGGTHYGFYKFIPGMHLRGQSS